nr:extracellular solute-binding protein [Lachnospiraceae bacterium]
YINACALSYGEETGTRVIPVLATQSKYLEAVNEASLKEEKAPDCFMISNESLERAYLAGLASDISGFYKDSDMPDTARNAMSYSNRLIAYPMYFETSVMLYNQNYMDSWINSNEDTSFAALSTVDDILSIADTLDAPEGMEQVMAWDVSDILYNYWFVGNYMVVGGECGDDEKCINVNNPETVQCLSKYQSLNQFFSIEAGKVKYDTVIKDFLEGKVMFTIAGLSAAKEVNDAATEGTLQFEVAAKTLPDVSVEHKSRNVSVTMGIAVNGYSSQKEKAYDFARFLGRDSSGDLYDKTGKVCVFKKDVFAQNPILKAGFESYESSIPMPKLMSTGNFWMKLEVMFSKIWKGEEIEPLLSELDSLLKAQTDL